MTDSSFFEWISCTADGTLDDLKMPDVKVEMHTDSFSFLTPPLSPSPVTNPISTPTSSLCRRSSKTSSPRNHRTRPYPETCAMSGNNYVWSVNRNPRSSERRSSDGDQSYAPDYPQSSMYTHRSASTRSSPSGMVSPSIPRADLYSGGMSSMDWAAAHQPSPASASVFPPEVPGIQYGPAFDDFSGSVGTPNSSGSGTLTSSPFHDTFSYDHSTNPSLHHQQQPFPSSSSSSASASPEEIRQLRSQIAELEHRHRLDKQRIQALETQMASSGCPPPPSPTFQASWRARTEARIRQFCSLNRAGNALCAWHDSRRERRIYPPRMAPEGYLNCGCTYQEALFEESLSRHSVGSYLPGDSVRMDPALRNPLLRLLQERYGYRDGDFERDSRSGNWVTGEGHERWEEQISRGIVNPRRPQRNDQNR
ncbi:hypothetical protein D9758_009573 [Tetrapyrgos nigripes]|uniref:Uncharacterized protein n=1 Tax=Tetrapyrgos nigripes TaxID=182062 RepID=A0A8H5GCZ9_9AGAR|nr:hypothetical protein D9758_009573 [Tetrapyrgos nigripes]